VENYQLLLLFIAARGSQHVSKLLSWTLNNNSLALDRRLSMKLVPNLRIEGAAWLAQRIPTAVNLELLDPESLLLPSSSSDTNEAE
jgi:hypothetical protein